MKNKIFKYIISITKDKSEIKDVAQKVKNLYVNDEQMESYIKLIKKDNLPNKFTLNGINVALDLEKNG